MRTQQGHGHPWRHEAAQRCSWDLVRGSGRSGTKSQILVAHPSCDLECLLTFFELQFPHVKWNNGVHPRDVIIAIISNQFDILFFRGNLGRSLVSGFLLP